MKKTSIMQLAQKVSELLKQSPCVEAEQDCFFIIFDKKNKPYLVTLTTLDKDIPSFRIDVYQANLKQQKINKQESIAHLIFTLLKEDIFIKKINVFDKRNSKLGLGTGMLTVLQMIGDYVEVKKYKGNFGNFSYLDKKPEALKRFYERNNFIFPEQFFGSSFEKAISDLELGKFKAKTINYPIDRHNIIVVLPDKKIEATNDFNK